MKTAKFSLFLWIAMGLVAWVTPARAAFFTFNASLLGAGENPPNASTATGFGTVILDDVAGTITVNESWTGLSAPATASHIHGPALPGSNAPVLFPFSGVPNATSGSIPQQVFSISTLQIGQLESGLYYMNVHDANFPGGEIRGQLKSVPDAGPGLIGAFTLLALCWAGFRSRRTSLAG